MKLIKYTFLIVFNLYGCVMASGQETDPYPILDSLKAKVMAINDYQVDLEIEVDVDFINMPVKHAQMFFKQPDKIKFKSDEFIMIPKKGLNNPIRKILDEPFTAIYVDSENIEGQMVDVIKIIPLGKKPDIVLATWYISQSNGLIVRSENNTRNDGTFNVDFAYGPESIALPQMMTITFEIEKLSLPMKFIGKTSGMEIDKTKMDGPQQGKVYIRFSNYLINLGLKDESFNEEENSFEE